MLEPIRLLDDFKIHRGLISLPLFTGHEAHTEYLLHEAGHAISLGIPVEGRFSTEVHRRLKWAGAFGSDTRNEAYVLGAEWILYGYAAHSITRAEILTVAKGQDVPVAMLDAACRSRRSLKLAHQIAAWALENGVFVICTETIGSFTELQAQIVNFSKRTMP